MPLQWVPRTCSSSSSGQGGKQYKHVVIYYPHKFVITRECYTGAVVCVSVDDLIRRPWDDYKPCKICYRKLSDDYLNFHMSCTTTGVGGQAGLYMFGGFDPPATCLEKVYRYDLHKMPVKGKMKRCKDMIAGVTRSLAVQVGDDCIYVLGFGKTQDDDDSLKLVFQEFNFEKDEWALVGGWDDIINERERVRWINYGINRAPHVVIGHKLHVSLGASSFTFDTAGKRVWEKCKLFDTFWSEQEKKKSGRRLEPSNIFYDRRVWDGLVEEAAKKGNSGPPFGFYGRGILWDKDVLLGVYYDYNCPLVAFLLDGQGRVVKSQRVTSNKLAMTRDTLNKGASLVDLGRDGYFGLVHFLPDANLKDALLMELVIFKVSRSKRPPHGKIAAASSDDGRFLDCHLVRKEIVARNCSPGIGYRYDAFSVR